MRGNRQAHIGVFRTLATRHALGSGIVADSPATLQSVPGECLRLYTDQLAHSDAQLHALFRVVAMTKISVALALGCSRASAAIHVFGIWGGRETAGA